MKVIASLVLSSVVVQAAHVACAGATVLENAVPPANMSEFKDSDGSDPIFTAAGISGSQWVYHDQFFKYTATCSGVGLIIVEGNSNLTQTNVDVWTGTCLLPVQVGVSDNSNGYTPADMNVQANNLPTGGGRMQFITTNGTEYIIRIGTYNDENNTALVGYFMYNIVAACVTPASNNPDMPTIVQGNGTFFYSNVNASTAPSNDCGAANHVYLGYTAECTGDISFELVSNGGDGFHGEDLKIGFYNYTLTDFTVPDTDLCQDDPAIISIYRNLSQAPVGGTREMGSVVQGKEYMITVSSYSAAVSPFVLQITGPLNCASEQAETSSAAALSLPALVAAMLMLSM